MFNNQTQFGVNPLMMGGPQYPTIPQARMTQPLTTEQIKSLRTNAPAFTLEISEEDILRARCTHKADGKFALIQNNDAEGTVTCSICGAKFLLSETNLESVQAGTQLIIDFLQTIKTYYLDMPDQIAMSYFQMIPFLEKLPKLYQIALENFNKYEGMGMANQSQGMYGFNMLGAITNPQFGFGGGQAFPMQQPGMMPMAPTMAPMGAVNPFGSYGASPYDMQQQQYMQPQAPIQQPIPQQVPVQNVNAQQQPQVPADPTGMVQNKVFNV